jgi:hypothetical protein
MTTPTRKQEDILRLLASKVKKNLNPAKKNKKK